MAVLAALSVYAGIAGGMMNERFTEVEYANVKPIVKKCGSDSKPGVALNCVGIRADKMGNRTGITL
ncbi:hypothetical protein SAMN04488689_101578 [Paenibacillus sp. cl6col]|uniref:Uncharacterized protein n=1 Tax=Paenibacillus alvei TaxID=44250 RepID=A0ABT4EF66_PAEAL|nr:MULTISPECIES: hypothetical protein [Paenibacillus]MCY9532317.1 hypothetical protein [Paenibacillus alvei]SDE46063.1 hypothetical protein SAMN04488689_101578 [Paenibacillus sp. cl6col]